jgi:ATP-binding cassette subfamily B protein
MMHGGWRPLLTAEETTKKTQIDRQLLRRIYNYARPYWLDVTLVLVAIILESLLGLIPPLLYRSLIDQVLPNGDFRGLTILAIGMVSIPILSGLIGVGERYFSSRMGEGIIFDLRQQMYDHLQRMPIRFFTRTKSGEIISRLNNDVVGAQNAITGTIPDIVTNIVTLISTLIVMISIEWRLTLLSIVVLPLFLLPTRRVAVILRDIRRKSMEFNAAMSSLINETLGINGALLVKTFGRQRYESEQYRKVNKDVRDIGVRGALVGRWFFLGLSISGAIGTALVYWIGGYMVLQDALTIGTIVAFAAYLTRLYGPITSLSNVQVAFISSIVSFERVFEYLDLPIEIADKPDAITLETVAGKIKFDNVSFSYLTETSSEENPNDDDENSLPDSERDDLPGKIKSRFWALQNLSFGIEPGQLIALVGPSGAGKTSVTYMLPRLYDPTEGAIYLDGKDLRDITLESLSRQIGMVTQETYLFHDTVRANLLYARADASQAELDSACQAANIYEFIQELTDGYDTIVGERGYRLSGGEKQRLAIARVILKDPRILILDEATSSLDSQNEALIQAALAPLFAGRTSLVIAHRLSTILAADRILVLDQGRLVEQGTHSELLAMDGQYASLYETQFKHTLSVSA